MKVQATDRAALAGFLLVISAVAPLMGLGSTSTVSFYLAYALATLWLFFTKKERIGALSLLWGVKMEPAPCDLLFIGAWGRSLLRGKLQWARAIPLNLLLAFILLNVFQVSISVSLSRGAWFAGATLYTGSLAFLFSTIPTVKEWRETRSALLFAVWTTVGIVLVLAVLGFLGWNEHILELYYDRRPRGFFKDPNVTGPFITVGTLFVLSQLLLLKKRFISPTGILLLLSLLALISTFSRGALLNLLMGMLVLGVIAVKACKGTRFVAVVAVTAGIILIALPYLASVFGQLFRFHGLASYDIYGRFAAWRAGLVLAQHYPWGIGPGQFEIFAPKYELQLLKNVLVTPSAHNTYLRVLVENGILGLGLFITALGILVMSLKQNIAIAIRIGDTEMLADGAWLASTLAGILAESFVIDTLHWRHFWILAGFAIAYGRLIKVREEE